MRKILFIITLSLSLKGLDITPFAINQNACLSSFQYDAYTCNYFKEIVNFVFMGEKIKNELKKLEDERKSKIINDKEKKLLDKKIKNLKNRSENIALDFLKNACFYYKNMNPINKINVDNYQVLTKDGLRNAAMAEELDNACFLDNPLEYLKEDK